VEDIMKEAMLYEPFGKQSVRCNLCEHRCVVPEGRLGQCGVRKNEKGKIYCLSYGKNIPPQLDPIEKKPFFHFMPGARVLSIGTPGCNFRCRNCQNDDLSQGIKSGMPFPKGNTPEEIVDMAMKSRSQGIAYTYNEPTVFFEFARDIILDAKERAPELKHMFVSNGYFSKEMLELVKKEKLLDAINIDLKFLDDETYTKITSGTAEVVKRNIRLVKDAGIHLEVICLIIPTLNDNKEFYEGVSDFISSVSKDIPLHFSAFFPHFQLRHLPRTDPGALKEARDLALSKGIKHVYCGNIRGEESENTYCPKCKSLLVRRRGYEIVENELKSPRCPKCREELNFVFQKG
jgi:pyruvate formate lyase activating enzyme